MSPNYSEDTNNNSINRRKFMKTTGATVGGASIGGLSFAGVAAGENSHPEFEIKEVTIVEETNEQTYGIVLIEFKHNKSDEQTTQRLLVTLGKGELTNAAVKEIDATTSRKLKNHSISAARLIKKSGENDGVFTVAGNEDLVERKQQVRFKADPCAVHSGYTHQFKGGTIEFKQSINNVGIITAAGLLALYAETFGIAALATIGGAIIALVSDFDSVTYGVLETDTIFGNITNWGSAIAGGYNVTSRDNFIYPDGGSLPFGHPYR